MGQSSCCATHCPNSLKLQGHFLGTSFPFFSPCPSFLVAVGRLGEQSVICSGVAATSEQEPSLGGISTFQHFLFSE